jgi:intracellular septation protein
MMDDRAKTRTPAAAPGRPETRQNPILKLALEMGPLLLFFLANWKFGLYAATTVLMVSVVASLAASWLTTRHIPTMPLVTAVAVLVFGTLTLFLHNELFIKLKPTIVNALFGTILLGGLAFGKPLLPVVLDSVLQLTEAGWRKLTLRWGVFFFFLALLNEIARHELSTDLWVSFKVFGTMPITIVFALSQVPLILRHELKGDAAADAPDHY